MNKTIYEKWTKNSNDHMNFCSATCLHDYQEEINNVDEYQLFEITRCSSYYDCLQIDNLRQMCTKEERLDYEPPLIGYLSNLSLTNFCEPADAGIIKASLNIHKQLEESSSQNKWHFKLTATMTILVSINNHKYIDNIQCYIWITTS